MNIDPKKGQKIKYLGFYDKGTNFDQEQAKKHLVTGEVYTIEELVVYAWNTDIVLREFPNLYFNSVMFNECDHELN